MENVDCCRYLGSTYLPNIYLNVIVSDNEINVPTAINIIIVKQEYNTKYIQCLQSENDNLYNIIITRYRHLHREKTSVESRCVNGNTRN